MNKLITISTILLLFFSSMKAVIAQHASGTDNLSMPQQFLVKIAGLTSIGELNDLEKAIAGGLDAGLTVNEIKESIVHLYAYCGFPRSIRGLQTFMKVLDERKRKGIIDPKGKEASTINNAGSKYERGKTVLGQLTKTPQDGPLTGYAAFAPTIDTFLKEHLFADIFERDVLTYSQRELVTISVLSAIGGVESMLKGHLTICLNVGLSPQQLKHFITMIESTIGKKEADSAKAVLAEVLIGRK